MAVNCKANESDNPLFELSELSLFERVTRLEPEGTHVIHLEVCRADFDTPEYRVHQAGGLLKMYSPVLLVGTLSPLKNGLNVNVLWPKSQWRITGN
jgi:hypothetical protein